MKYILQHLEQTCEVKSMNPGVTAASKAPRKNRTTSAPEKLLTAAIQQSMRPQTITQKDEYLAKGRRWRSRLVGYSHTRYPARVNLVLLKDVSLRTKIKHASEPLILISGEINVFFHAHYTGI